MEINFHIEMETMEYLNFTTGAPDTDLTPDYIPLYLAVDIPWLVIYLVIYTGIFVAGFVGNLLVIASFRVEPKLRKVTNYYFYSLAHADFLATISGLPTTIFARLVWGTATCFAKYRQYFFVMAFMMCSISIGHLVLITIDRFIAVTWPLRYRRWVTFKRCKIGLAIIWLLGLTFGILPLIGELENPNEWVCGIQRYDGAAVTVSRLIAIVALPAILFVLACCYVHIFIVAMKWSSDDNQYLRRSRSTRAASDKQDAERKSTLRATITTVLILGVFAICWLPSSVKFFVETYIYTTDEVLFLIQSMAEMLNFSNSAINPYLYASRNQDFKRAYEKVLRLYVLRCICIFRNSPYKDENEISTIHSTMSTYRKTPSYKQ